MDDLKSQLDELNVLAERVCEYAEDNGVTLTRRRLLLLQKLSFVDSNVNAIARLIFGSPRFLDEASMIMRSIYDLSVNVDWVLGDRKNTRLWRWLRDDRKTLRSRIKNIIDIKTSNPRLNSASDPLSVWQSTYNKVDGELSRMSKKANVTVQAREESLLAKVKTFNASSQLVYHTVFWLFSAKTHASATGLQDMVRLNPLKVRRRDYAPNASDDKEAEMLMRTTLLWYSASILRTAEYFRAPFTDDAKQAYQKHIGQ